MGSVQPVKSVFETVFDVIVVGSGYAALGAVLTLRSQGRDVLLVASQGDLVWESGRAFCPTPGRRGDTEWSSFMRRIAHVGGCTPDWVDGAVAEVVATEVLVESGCRALYYARPVALDRDRNLVTSATFATRAGPRRLAARQWVDASETGELMRLVATGIQPQAPVGSAVYVALQHADWSTLDREIESLGTDLLTTGWESERILRIDTTHLGHAWRSELLRALVRLEENLGPAIANLSVSHLSFVPISVYPGDQAATLPAVGNVANASPCLAAGPVSTLADRFGLGVDAASRLGTMDTSAGHRDELFARPLARPSITSEMVGDVCVVGCGTGGSLAVLAAARDGAAVIGVEPMTFAGGIGTGGGIHVYWFGVPGGLQATIDVETKAIMNAFGGGPFGDGPFNPWAKTIALEEAFSLSSAEIVLDAMVFDVERSGENVDSVLVATRDGVSRIRAAAFVDGTGDGDLCAMAGAEFSLGREVDGLTHAYSQSSGRLELIGGRPRMRIVNIDAGFCDPTDPEDLTRARIDGVLQYLLPRPYTNLSRPTYIAPALGIRQGRQVLTDYVLTLDDLISRQRFPDAVGFTASHLDNHATDFEFESDEAVFWVWANRQFHVPIACETSYRMLLPRGLRNVVIGSRCLGVTQDAHYVTRMQRDMQRIGEVAGSAAAIAARQGGSSREVPLGTLQQALLETRALSVAPRALETRFGVGSTAPGVAEGELNRGEQARGMAIADAALRQLQAGEEAQQTQTAKDAIRPELGTPDVALALTDALATLDAGLPGASIWWLYKNPGVARAQVLARLHHATDPMVTWLAACIVAMWGDSAAEPRLLEAIEDREYGFGSADPRSTGARGRPTRSATPANSDKVVPNWLCALALLRRCGTARSLPTIQRLLDLPVRHLDTLATIGITLERMVLRGTLGAADRDRVRDMVETLGTITPHHLVDYPDRSVGVSCENDLRASVGALGLAPARNRSSDDAAFAELLVNTRQDSEWQLALVLARTRRALGTQPEVERFREDSRALVRRAFQRLDSPSLGEVARPSLAPGSAGAEGI